MLQGGTLPVETADGGGRSASALRGAINDIGAACCVAVVLQGAEQGQAQGQGGDKAGSSAMALQGTAQAEQAQAHGQRGDKAVAAAPGLGLEQAHVTSGAESEGSAGQAPHRGGPHRTSLESGGEATPLPPLLTAGTQTSPSGVPAPASQAGTARATQVEVAAAAATAADTVPPAAPPAIAAAAHTGQRPKAAAEKRRAKVGAGIAQASPPTASTTTATTTVITAPTTTITQTPPSSHRASSARALLWLLVAAVLLAVDVRLLAYQELAWGQCGWPLRNATTTTTTTSNPASSNISSYSRYSFCPPHQLLVLPPRYGGKTGNVRHKEHVAQAAQVAPTVAIQTSTGATQPAQGGGRLMAAARFKMSAWYLHWSGRVRKLVQHLLVLQRAAGRAARGQAAAPDEAAGQLLVLGPVAAGRGEQASAAAAQAAAEESVAPMASATVSQLVMGPAGRADAAPAAATDLPAAFQAAEAAGEQESVEAAAATASREAEAAPAKEREEAAMVAAEAAGGSAEVQPSSSTAGLGAAAPQAVVGGAALAGEGPPGSAAAAEGVAASAAVEVPCAAGAPAEALAPSAAVDAAAAEPATSPTLQRGLWAHNAREQAALALILLGLTLLCATLAHAPWLCVACGWAPRECGGEDFIAHRARRAAAMPVRQQPPPPLPMWRSVRGWLSPALWESMHTSVCAAVAVGGRCAEWVAASLWALPMSVLSWIRVFTMQCAVGSRGAAQRGALWVGRAVRPASLQRAPVLERAGQAVGQARGLRRRLFEAGEGGGNGGVEDDRANRGGVGNELMFGFHFVIKNFAIPFYSLSE